MDKIGKGIICFILTLGLLCKIPKIVSQELGDEELSEVTTSEGIGIEEEKLEEEVESSMIEEETSVIEAELAVDETQQIELVENEEPVEASPLLAPAQSIIIQDAIVVEQAIYEDTQIIIGYLDIEKVNSTVLTDVALETEELHQQLLSQEVNLSVNQQHSQSTNLSTDGSFTFHLQSSLPADAHLTFSIQPIQLSTHSLEIEAKVVFVKGHQLAFHQLPSKIIFQTTETEFIPDKLIYRASPSDLSISILNPGNKTWSLSVSAQGALTTADASHSLPNALVFKQETSPALPLSPDSLPIATSNTSTEDPTNLDFDVITWNSDEGLLLQLNPFYTLEETEYSTTINWTLTNGIQ